MIKLSNSRDLLRYGTLLYGTLAQKNVKELYLEQAQLLYMPCHRLNPD